MSPARRPRGPRGGRIAEATGDEAGAALLTVLGFGALASLVMLGLAGRVAEEARGVADSLVQTRAYWAAMGMNAYALSRTMQSGGCGADCGNALVGVQQGYVNEIKDMQLWRYPEVGAAYALALSPVASQDAVSGAQEMLLRTTFASPPAAAPAAPGSPGAGPAAVVPDALAQLGRLRPVEFRYCLIASSGTTSCKSGMSKAPPTYQLVTSVHRPSS